MSFGPISVESQKKLTGNRRSGGPPEITISPTISPTSPRTHVAATSLLRSPTSTSPPPHLPTQPLSPNLSNWKDHLVNKYSTDEKFASSPHGRKMIAEKEHSELKGRIRELEDLNTELREDRDDLIDVLAEERNVSVSLTEQLKTLTTRLEREAADRELALIDLETYKLKSRRELEESRVEHSKDIEALKGIINDLQLKVEKMSMERDADKREILDRLFLPIDESQKEMLLS